jgi:peptidoglycan/xylan/chitin deacetylase (PgdA/CDA1 family)
MNRRLVYKAAALLGVNLLARAVFRRRLLVLSYHGVCGETPSVPDPDGLHVPVQLFEQQIKQLLRYYHPVSLSQVKMHVLEGGPLPASAVLLTFDDGYRNVALHALPVLRQMGVPCALFPVPGAIEAGSWLWTSEVEYLHAKAPDFVQLKRRLKGLTLAERHHWLSNELNGNLDRPECDYSLLNWDDLATELARGSIEIGSHGLNHEPLTGCTPAELEVELSESRRLIRERLKMDAQVVAYPNGDSAPSVIEAARDSGYCLGFTTVARHVRAGDDPLDLPRILVGRWDTPSVLAARLAGWQEWLRVN